MFERSCRTLASKGRAMTDTSLRTTSTTPSDPDFGYTQELHRGVGSFSSFAAGFSFVSILTTVFQLFGLGFGLGGAAFFWTWPVVFAGQLLVALNFAQLSARWPISGAIFHWSSRLAGAAFGWMTGWIMVVGQVITVAVAAIAVQVVLPSIWDGFQIVGGPGADPSVSSPTGAANAIVLGLAMLLITTLVNIFSVRLMARITSFGVIVEILGAITLITILFFLPQRGPSVLMTTEGRLGTDPYIFAWLASSLMAAYVLVGFDSASELAEETHSPRRTTPRTIVRAVLFSGLGGGLLIVAGLLAAPSLTDGNLSSYGLSYVITSVLGETGGRIMLCTVAVAVFACTLAVQTAGARMMFSMSREKAFPFHRVIGRVSPRTGTPIAASIVVGVGAAVVLALNYGQPAVFTALSSLCIAMLYVAYLGVTLPLLVMRVRLRRSGGLPGGVDEEGKPLFSLGRWGLPLNAVAVVFQVLMVVNLVWPRADIYDPAGISWALQWSALLAIAATFVGGAVYYRLNRRRQGSLVLAPVSDSATIPA